MTFTHVRAPGASKEFRVRPYRLRVAAAGVVFAALSAAGFGAAAQDRADLQLQTTVPAFCQSLWSSAPSMDVGSLTDQNGMLVTSFVGTASYQTPASSTATPLRR